MMDGLGVYLMLGGWVVGSIACIAVLSVGLLLLVKLSSKK